MTQTSSHTSGGIASINPTDGRLLREYAPHSKPEVERRLQTASDAFQKHRRMPLPERARLMLRVAEILESEKDNYARMMTQEMGKLFRAAVQEVKKCALGCRYYAQNAAGFLADEEAAIGTAPPHPGPLSPSGEREQLAGLCGMNR